MKRWTAERWARLGITVQFLALVRSLAEWFRLRYVAHAAFTPGMADAWVGGSLVSAVLCWLAVTFYFFGRTRAAVGSSVASVAVLIAYKLVFIG